MPDEDNNFRVSLVLDFKKMMTSHENDQLLSNHYFTIVLFLWSSSAYNARINISGHDSHAKTFSELRQFHYKLISEHMEICIHLKCQETLTSIFYCSFPKKLLHVKKKSNNLISICQILVDKVLIVRSVISQSSIGFILLIF